MWYRRCSRCNKKWTGFDYEERKKLVGQRCCKTDEEKFKTLFNILRAKDLKATYKIENANHASLLKVQDGSVEKGMTYLNNVQLGSLNKSVRSYFEGLQQDNSDDRVISAFSNGMIPHERAIRALHEDSR